MLSIEFTANARFKVDGWGGIAFYYHGNEMRDTEDTEWDGIQEPTGNIIVIMVGDDREFIVDPDDCTLIDDDEYCHECGQIGCYASNG
jgi:hypothetical protein